jgi:hypothetical protein
MRVPGTPTATLPRPRPARAAPRPPRGSGAWRRLVTLAGLVVCGGAMGAAVAVVDPSLLDDDQAAEPTQPTRPVLRDGTVVGALRPLGAATLASGEFETEIVDDSSDDGSPSYVAVASVDAVVDFTSLSDRDVRLVDRGRGVLVVLPDVVLGAPVLDEERSGVIESAPSILEELFRFGDFEVDETGLGEPAVDEEALRAAAVDDLSRQAEGSTLRDTARQAALDLVRRSLAGLAGMGLVRIDVRFTTA